MEKSGNPMKRYLLAIPEFPPETVGGGGIVFSELATRYARDGELLVLTGSWSGTSRRPLVTKLDTGGTLVRVPLIRDRFDLPPLRSTLPPRPSSRHLTKELVRAWSPTVGHLHGYGYLFIDWIASLLHSSGIPFVFTSHGLPVSYASGRGKCAKIAAFRVYESMVASRTVKYASAVTAISELAKPPQREATIIPNGVTPLPSANCSLSDDKDSVRIAAAGRLVPSKGFDILIRALHLTDATQLECAIAGLDCGDLPRLRNIAACVPKGVTVRFPGPLDRQGIADLFANSHMVVVPSLTEPFGLVAFEALSLGKRVVATRTGGLADWLSEPELPVCLVVPGSVEALAVAIRDTIRLGPVNSRELASVNRLFQQLNWDSVAGRYLQLANTLSRRKNSQQCRLVVEHS